MSAQLTQTVDTQLGLPNWSTMMSRPGGLTRGALVFVNTNKPIPTYLLLHQSPADDDAEMEAMKTRYRELYFSFLRLDKLNKKTTTKNNDRISSEQKKEIQEEARHVGLFLKEYDSLWTE